MIGNIYHQTIREIFENHRDLVTFNHEIQGQCGHCEHNWVCIGCRGGAYVYLRDMWVEGGPHFVGRGPKCPLNPEAKEVYLQS